MRCDDRYRAGAWLAVPPTRASGAWARPARVRAGWISRASAVRAGAAIWTGMKRYLEPPHGEG